MLLKGRSESDELLILRALNTRMKLAEKERYHYLTLEKGYEGELQFDHLTERIEEERYIINDLLLEVNNAYFQIDTLIISQGGIHLIDVKNYQDDWYFESDKLYIAKTRREIKNPVDQLKRCETMLNQLLNQLLHQHKLNYLVESFVIFINPEFTLYQAPMDLPIIFPTQINRFLNELNKTPSKLNDGHKKLAQKLISLHQTKNPYGAFPKFNYDQLQKGVYCNRCNSFQVKVKNIGFEFQKCGHVESIDSCLIRHIEEFKLLNPGKKMTTQAIFDWCKTDLNKRTFLRVLKKNYTAIGNTKNTFYI